MWVGAGYWRIVCIGWRSDYWQHFILSNERVKRGRRETNHGLLRWARKIPASWDWQKKSKNLASLLAEFLF